MGSIGSLIERPETVDRVSYIFCESKKEVEDERKDILCNGRGDMFKSSFFVHHPIQTLDSGRSISTLQRLQWKHRVLFNRRGWLVSIHAWIFRLKLSQ
jgi:hypothetical protein